MMGPGKYDSLATHCRMIAGARGVIVAIIDGERGSGFSVQADADLTRELPTLLRTIASAIEGGDHAQ